MLALQSTSAYTRHEPEKTILYRVIQENFETFLAEAQKANERLPLHVYQEVEAYLGCGILQNGFIRIQCDSCKEEKLVAFSCKKRGFCPSCGGRRMNEVAAHLVDSVFPKVPVRQWVLSFPFSVRYALAFNPALVTRVLGIFNRIVSNWYVKAARKNNIDGKTGAVEIPILWGELVYVSDPYVYKEKANLRGTNTGSLGPGILFISTWRRFSGGGCRSGQEPRWDPGRY